MFGFANLIIASLQPFSLKVFAVCSISLYISLKAIDKGKITGQNLG
jgi:hypothetical protein